MIRTPCTFQILLECEYQETIFKVAERSGFGFFSSSFQIVTDKNVENETISSLFYIKQSTTHIYFLYIKCSTSMITQKNTLLVPFTVKVLITVANPATHETNAHKPVRGAFVS